MFAGGLPRPLEKGLWNPQEASTGEEFLWGGGHGLGHLVATDLEVFLSSGRL